TVPKRFVFCGGMLTWCKKCCILRGGMLMQSFLPRTSITVLVGDDCTLALDAAQRLAAVSADAHLAALILTDPKNDTLALARRSPHLSTTPLLVVLSPASSDDDVHTAQDLHALFPHVVLRSLRGVDQFAVMS